MWWNITASSNGYSRLSFTPIDIVSSDFLRMYSEVKLPYIMYDISFLCVSDNRGETVNYYSHNEEFTIEGVTQVIYRGDFNLS